MNQGLGLLETEPSTSPPSSTTLAPRWRLLRLAATELRTCCESFGTTLTDVESRLSFADSCDEPSGPSPSHMPSWVTSCLDL